MLLRPEAQAFQAVFSALGTFLVESGMALPRSEFPNLGRAGFVGLTSAASALIGLLAGAGVEGRGLESIDRELLVASVVASFVVSYACSLALSRTEMKPIARGMLVSAAAAIAAVGVDNIL